MAKMALRAYTREIEELIEHGQIKESIAHARHILSSFPKYIDAYRLLGKAYLEEQLYGEAADIFQRVLSTKPDDFISNVGMSIIREDEGNLDASIWHMERAFEVQPSNKAIQDELRRLFGRRDGMQPPKIRLTKGALARMYAHGDLHDQAIAEIQAALKDDPQRHDLLILLAKMYYNSGKQSQAIDACNLILEKLPYCLDANYIMLKIYQRSGEQQEADYYRTTVASLDPYSAMTTKTAPLSENVAANTVTIEHLEWHPGMLEEMGVDAAWVSKLGLSGEKKDGDGEEKPEWLTATYDDGDEAGRSESPFVIDEAHSEEMPQDEVLPEWMMGAVDEGEETVEEAAPVNDEIPDWLKEEGAGDTTAESEMVEGGGDAAAFGLSESGMEPTAMGDEESIQEPGDGEELPEFLREAGWEEGSSEENDTLVFDEEDLKEAKDEITPAEIPDWMQAMKPEGTEDEAEVGGAGDLGVGAAAGGSLDWLGDSEAPAEQPTEEAAAMDWLGDSEAPAEQPTEEAAAMDWLGDSETPAEQSTEERAEEETPDWMSGLEQAGEGEYDDEETPSWLQELAGEEETPETEAGGDIASETPDWLGEAEEPTDETEPQAVDMGAAPDLDWLAAEEDPSHPPEAAEDPMDRIASLSEDTPPVEEIEEQPAGAGDGETPEWMKGMVTGEEPVEEATEIPVEEEPAPADSMSWLDEISSEEPAGEGAEAVEEGEEAAATPDWLGEISAEHESLSDESPAAPTGEAQPVVEGEPGSDYVLGIDDQSMSWLEGLAAKQGAPEEELFSEPEERAAEMPEWLQGMEEISDDVPPDPDPTMEGMEAAGETPVEEDGEVEADAKFPFEAPPGEVGGDASEMSWVDEVSEDALAEEGFGVRKGGDTSQLIRSLAFDAEGEPRQEAAPETGLETSAEAEAQSEQPIPDVQSGAGDWTTDAEGEMDEGAPPEVVPAARRATKTGELDFTDVYQKGLVLLQSGDLENAIKSFADLIKRGFFLDEIITALESAVVQFPIEISLYQTMGDAYMRADRLQDALDSYSKAEELLR